MFSLERAQLPSSNFKVFAGPLGKARKVDAHTVEIEPPVPTPAGVFLQNLHALRIVSKVWCQKNNVGRPQDFKTGEETYASTRANGRPLHAGQARVRDRHDPQEVPDWWGLREGTGDRRFEGNVDEIVYRPIKSNATRMAALLSGELDLVAGPVAAGIPRLRSDPGVRIVEGAENRVIFLVMDQERDELKYSSVKGKNPLKDLRVRRRSTRRSSGAIKSQVMRGASVPTGAMIPAPPSVFPPLEPRLLPFDPMRAKVLLAEAGYPMASSSACSAQRPLCQRRAHLHALAAMLARVG